MSEHIPIDPVLTPDDGKAPIFEVLTQAKQNAIKRDEMERLAFKDVTVTIGDVPIGELLKPRTTVKRNYPRHVKNSLMVREFMTTFYQPVKDSPEFPPRRVAWMRLKLILEEVWELIIAMKRRDMVEIADALGDLVYVCIGMAHTYGIPFDEAFREIHRSNMAKAGPDGKPIYRKDGKIIKPEGWTPPDLRKVMGL